MQSNENCLGGRENSDQDHRCQSALPAANDFSATWQYSSHPLLKGSFFYALPLRLLEIVESEVGKEKFDRELMKMEFALSQPCGDPLDFAGYWNGSPLRYRGFNLRYSRMLSEKDKTAFPASAQQELKDLNIYDVSWDYPIYRRDFRSYGGWLLTNSQFLDEQAQLFDAHQQAIHRWGPRRPQMPEVEMIHVDQSKDPNRDPCWRDYSSQQQELLARWRLGGLVPYLPEPLEPEMSGSISNRFLSQFATAGIMFFLPDTVPLPSRDELRESIEYARSRRRKAEHLCEWFKLIRPNNSARNQLDRLSRIFELQHYWRILHVRHANAIRKSVIKLEIAFATWFDVSQETIHGDLIRVRQLLGKHWLERRFP